MKHFLVYRDPGYWKNPFDPRFAFRAHTTKRVERTVGARVWIISRESHPDAYFLVSTFIVEQIGRDRRALNPNWMAAYSGQLFGRKFVVSNSAWWHDVMTVTGGMRWGLTPIRSKRAINALDRIARTATPPRRTVRMATDPRFSPSSAKDRVERSAIHFASKYYKDRGWEVRSVELEGRGYDLLCLRCSKQLHVEVKGCSRQQIVFGLTENELESARNDPEFRLLVVTSALSAPKALVKTGRQLLSGFAIEPTVWIARQKTDVA